MWNEGQPIIPQFDEDGERFLYPNCKRAMKMIRELDENKLSRVGEVSKIPYMGMGVPPDRPGGDIDFYSVPEYGLLLDCLNKCRRKDFFLLGCIGIGKSCLLRAVVATLIKDSQPKVQDKKATRERFVCIWNAEELLDDLFSTLKDALSFTYCEEEDLDSAVSGLLDLDAIISFIKQRREQNEFFHFVLDGGELLDYRNSSGENSDERRKCKLALKSVTRHGRCIYALPPQAEDNEELRRKHVNRYCELRGGFRKEAYNSYMDNDALGGVCESNPRRVKDIYYLAGRHPLFLAKLTKLIMYIVGEGASRDEVAHFFEAENEWLTVKQRYVETVRLEFKADLEAIKERVKDLPPRSYYSADQMQSIDPRYIIVEYKGEPSKFCTPMLHTMYTEAFREAEESQYLSHWLAAEGLGHESFLENKAEEKGKATKVQGKGDKRKTPPAKKSKK